VDEYYDVKDKCLAEGWEPGQTIDPAQAAANGPHRVLAQALMKRCIVDIHLVTHMVICRDIGCARSTSRACYICPYHGYGINK